MTPATAVRLAYRVARREGLDPAAARVLVTIHMHPEVQHEPMMVRFLAQCAAIRARQDSEAKTAALW